MSRVSIGPPSDPQLSDYSQKLLGLRQSNRDRMNVPHPHELGVAPHGEDRG